MSNLQFSNQSDLLAYIKSELMGSTQKVSIRGLARMCTVDPKSIISGGDFKSEKLGQILTEQGFRLGTVKLKGFHRKLLGSSLITLPSHPKLKLEGRLTYTINS